MRFQVFRLRAGLLAAVLVAMGPLAPESAAWGPRTTATIAGGAAGIINDAGVANLSARQRDIVRGASVSNEELAEMIPGAAGEPISAIAREIYLLQAVRGQGIDAYFAFRLGVLGKLVANTTAPLATADRLVREQYFSDVDGAIGTVSLNPGRRIMVDPPAYFNRVLGEVATREELLLSDYRGGLGFDGVARAALSQDAGRSAHAVADVWYTIFRGTVAVANLPEAQLQRYIIEGLRFYVERDNDAALDAAYERFMAMTDIDTDLRTRIGDMLYEAGARERAVREYKHVAEAQPGRRDVVQRIAEYYVGEGEDALDDQQLESAQVAFAEALRFDMLHPTAQERLVQTERLIREREERLAEDESRVETADSLRREADVRVGEGDFIVAMDNLQEAMNLYQSVSEEFPGPRAAANMGLNAITVRLNELKNQLISNAGDLSGSGASLDARLTAEAGQQATNENALRRLVEQQYNSEIERLREELGGPIMDEAPN